MIENDDMIGNTITLLPPVNAIDDVTDEDSGDEDFVNMNNLPASLMQSKVEVSSKYNSDNHWDLEDDTPLAQIKENLSVSVKKAKNIYKSIIM
ncbi:hypothetical protein QE152_g31308 [Popillia japonica]|uniref:Uncharacterized protein n=1 Tax=Popillia japonica TaxID=7064 RepID=A0AAW1JAE5_POPJA